MEKYRVDDYEFDSKEEYDINLQDYKIIAVLNCNYDIKDKMIANKILEMYGQGKIPFKGTIGRDFIKIISNIGDYKVEYREPKEEWGEAKSEVINSTDCKIINHNINLIITITICVELVLILILATIYFIIH